MSRKDVEIYYNKITNDYKEMLDALKEMEELAAQDIVNPDKVEELRAAVQPLTINYQRISYIMFLLNQPAKKEKVKRYTKANQKFLNKCDTTEHDENLEVIKAANQVWNGTKN